MIDRTIERQQLKTATVSFRIEEDKLTHIDEIIVKYSSTSGIKTRSEFMSTALDHYLAQLRVNDPRLSNLAQIHVAREEAAFWASTEKQLSDLMEQKTKPRLEKAKEILKMASSCLRSNTYKDDIEQWRELLNETVHRGR